MSPQGEVQGPAQLQRHLILVGFQVSSWAQLLLPLQNMGYELSLFQTSLSHQQFPSGSSKIHQ